LSEISSQIRKFCRKNYENSESDNLALVLKELQSEINHLENKMIELEDELLGQYECNVPAEKMLQLI
jgi:hypothetical protein